MYTMLSNIVVEFNLLYIRSQWDRNKKEKGVDFREGEREFSTIIFHE